MLAFRLATQRLADPAASIAEVARGWALGDSPPGAAMLALVARVRDLAPDALDDALLTDRTLVAVYNPRTAVSLVPSEDLAAFGAALLPRDSEQLEALVRPAVPDPGIGAQEAVDLATAAARRSCANRLRTTIPRCSSVVTTSVALAFEV